MRLIYLETSPMTSKCTFPVFHKRSLFSFSFFKKNTGEKLFQTQPVVCDLPTWFKWRKRILRGKESIQKWKKSQRKTIIIAYVANAFQLTVYLVTKQIIKKAFFCWRLQKNVNCKKKVVGNYSTSASEP